MNINPATINMDILIISAVRYALGRSSYAPSCVVDAVIQLMPEMRPESFPVMLRDIRDQRWQSCSGLLPCAADWERLEKALQERMKESDSD